MTFIEKNSKFAYSDSFAILGNQISGLLVKWLKTNTIKMITRAAAKNVKNKLREKPAFLRTFASKVASL